MMRLIAITLLLLFVCACSSEPTTDGANSIPNDEGNTFLLEATRAAQRAISERKTATIQSATLSAGATREFVERSTTGTAEALQVREQEMNLNATSQAIAIQQQETRQAATATAIMDAQHLSETQTIVALQSTATTEAATATRGAQELIAAQERHQATATAEALEIERTRAQQDAARAQAWGDFFDSLMKVLLGVGGIAALIMLLIQVARYLDVLSMRQRVLETRAGTIMVFASQGQYTAQIIKPTPNLLDNAESDFQPSQAAAVPEQELLKLTTAQGETFITKTDPEQEAREAERRLALRLLRESIRHYSNLKMDARELNRIPSFRDLGWSSETWVRAVQSLKPYVIATQGRGGGTYCTEEFPTLMTLYNAVGERRIGLNATVLPSPTVQEVAA